MTGVVPDTNVISEARRRRPDERIAAWLRTQAPERLFLTATVVGERAAGTAALPRGRSTTSSGRTSPAACSPTTPTPR